MDQLLSQNLTDQAAVRAAFASLQAKLQHEFDKVIHELETEAVELEKEEGAVTERCRAGAARIKRLDRKFDDIMKEEINQRLFEKAIEKGDLPQIRYFLKNTDVVFTATEKKEEKEISRVIMEREEKGISRVIMERHKEGLNALQRAVNANQVESVRLLLADPRSDPTADSYDVLHESLYNPERHEIVRVLLMDPRMRTPEVEDYLSSFIREGFYVQNIKALLVLAELRDEKGNLLFSPTSSIFKQQLTYATNALPSTSVEDTVSIEFIKYLLEEEADGHPRFSWTSEEIIHLRKTAEVLEIDELVEISKRRLALL